MPASRTTVLISALSMASAVGVAAHTASSSTELVPTASPICASASTNGTTLGERDFGPVCVWYQYATLCRYVSAGLPQAGVAAETCHPVP